MDRRIYILALLSVILHFAAAEISAQPKAVSTIWSLSGIGAGYEHTIDSDSFIQVDLISDTADLFNGKSWTPGATVSLTWNMIFKTITSKYGSTINIYAGPGTILGWTDDNKAPTGGLFGVKGRIGVEWLFDRRISISASLSPSVAMHLSMGNDGEFNMRTHRNALIYGMIPEIGIKYCFKR